MTRSAPYEKSKSLGSGGSMVARLKLKGIDGRAPPGVTKHAWLCSSKPPERVKVVPGSMASPRRKAAGDTLRLREVPNARGYQARGRKVRVAGVMPPGTVTTPEMLQWVIRSRTPTSFRTPGKVQRLDGRGWDTVPA
jgi:hypothetical protein